MNVALSRSDDALEIIAFILHERRFCVRTTSIREIRGWSPVTPLPETPADILGVMNLRGLVIPIVDLALRLGMPAANTTGRSAIVVTQVESKTIGMMVDRVSDILTVSQTDLQPVPRTAGGLDTSSLKGIFARDADMICFLDLVAIFATDHASHRKRPPERSQPVRKVADPSCSMTINRWEEMECYVILALLWLPPVMQEVFVCLNV